MLQLVNFGRFMTSEGTEAFILTFTLKTGQAVAHNNHRIFYWDFFLSERGNIKVFYRLYFRP